MNPNTQRAYPASILIFLCGLLLWIGQPALFAFGIGAKIQTVGSFNVRQTPAGTVLGTQSLGSRGVVVGGPTVALLNGTAFTWWNIDFASGTDGWVADTGLTTAWAQGLDVYHDNGTINW